MARTIADMVSINWSYMSRLNPFAWLSFGDTVDLAMNQRCIQRVGTWSDREYNMKLQGMRINALNTIREETRDQLARITRSLDNLMLVSSLMLTFGFGFVVEGTFPPSEKDYGGQSGLEYDDVQTLLLHLYIVSCSLVLLCPFSSMMLALAMRQQVDKLQARVMVDLKRELTSLLEDALTDSGTNRRQTRRRRNETIRRQRSWMGMDVGWGRDLRMEYIDPDTVERLKEELVKKISSYNRFYPVAQWFLWAGILAGLFLCSILLGLYMHHNYEDYPQLSMMYSLSVIASAVAGMVLLSCYGSVFRDFDNEDPSDILDDTESSEEETAAIGALCPSADLGDKRPRALSMSRGRRSRGESLGDVTNRRRARSSG